jgi:hypothetical protein
MDVNACISLPAGLSVTSGAGHWPYPCHSLGNIHLGATNAAAWLILVDTTFIFDSPVPIEFTVRSSDSMTIIDTAWITIPYADGIPPFGIYSRSKIIAGLDLGDFYDVPFIIDGHSDVNMNYTSWSNIDGSFITLFF